MQQPNGYGMQQPPGHGQAEPPPVACPKCRSTQVAANQQGFGVGKAIGGALIAGPLGLLAGTHGSKKIIVSCMACGHQWDPTVKPPPPTNYKAWAVFLGIALLFGSCSIALATRKPSSTVRTEPWPTASAAPAVSAPAAKTASATTTVKPAPKSPPKPAATATASAHP